VGESHVCCPCTTKIHDPKAKIHSKKEYGCLLGGKKTGQRDDDIEVVQWLRPWGFQLKLVEP